MSVFGAKVDQGCQFTSKELDLWAYGKGVVLDFSRPGKPTDNAYAESFNAIVRMESLGQHWFLDLSDAQEKVENWRRHSNEVRPHGAIGDRSPQTMISKVEAPRRALEVDQRQELPSQPSLDGRGGPGRSQRRARERYRSSPAYGASNRTARHR